VRGHDPASRRIIEDETVEEERAGAGDPTDPQPPKVAVPGIEDVIELPVHHFTRFASTFRRRAFFRSSWSVIWSPTSNFWSNFASFIDFHLLWSAKIRSAGPEVLKGFGFASVA
jgi:hypothetical protein